MSREMKIRPSQLVEVPKGDSLAVYCFDRAVTAFGDALLAELKNSSADSKTQQEAQVKTNRILAKWLPEAGAGRKAFQDPAKRSG